MKASSERKLMRWIHILLSIPIIGYVYGPVAEIPEALVVVRFFLVLIIIVSGFWMWKGSALEKFVSGKGNPDKNC